MNKIFNLFIKIKRIIYLIKNYKEILQNSKRYIQLKNDYIMYKPANYDGLSYGRFDLFEPCESSDLDSYLDLTSFNKYFTNDEYDKYTE